MPLTKRASVPMTTNVGGFWEWLPTGYNTGTQYPCIIFFHGQGHQGSGSSSSLDIMLNGGVTKFLNDSGFPYNAVVLCPQYQGGYPSGALIQNVINYAKANYSLNTNKIYLTGYSLGGAIVDNWGDTGTLTDIAAMVVVAGAAGYNASVATKYKTAKMPFMFHHGTLDGVVSINSTTRAWVTGLNTSPGIVPTAQKNEIVGGGHNVDTTVYDYTYKVDNKNYAEWLLQFDRSVGYDNPPVFNGKVNVGGIDETLAGQAWVGLLEAYASGGVFTDVIAIWGTDQTITNVPAGYDAKIYKSARRGGSGFTISYPTQNGSYTLRLHFCEFWHNVAGRNVFNVSVQGTQVLTGLDVWSVAGGRYRAYYQDFPVTISNGTLTIQTTATAGDAMLNAFELIPGGAANIPPVVNAGSDQTITLPTSTVSLSATASDADGSIASYAWSKVLGGAATITTPNAANTTVTGLAAGSYTFRCTVTDNAGATTADDVVITVNPAPPATNIIYQFRIVDQAGVQFRITTYANGSWTRERFQNNNWTIIPY